MPTARSEMRAAVMDGVAYVPGGLGPARTLGAFEAFDPTQGRWQVLEPLPEPVHHAGVAAADGRVFVAGGYTDLRFRTDHAAMWAYDPGEGAWTRMPDMPAPRAGHALVALNGVLYVVGGVGRDATDLWRFDVRRGVWLDAGAPLPTPREHLDAVALDGTIYAIGGRWSSRGNVGTVAAYDPVSNEWSSLPELPTPRSGLTASVLQGRIHVVGGESLSGGATFVEHEVYDPETRSWRAAASLAPGRHGLASAALHGRLYVIGGATRAGGQTFGSLTDTLSVWGAGR